MDRHIVDIISQMYSNHIREFHTLPSIPASARRDSQYLVDAFARVEQSDSDIHDDGGMVPVRALDFIIQWSGNESHDEYARSEDSMVHDGPSVPVDDTIEIELTGDHRSADWPTQVGDSQ
jgi:hypothetical protein